MVRRAPAKHPLSYIGARCDKRAMPGPLSLSARLAPREAGKVTDSRKVAFIPQDPVNFVNFVTLCASGGLPA